MICMIQAQFPGFHIMGKTCTEKKKIVWGEGGSRSQNFSFQKSMAGLWNHVFSLIQQSLKSSGTVPEVQQQVPELPGR